MILRFISVEMARDTLFHEGKWDQWECSPVSFYAIRKIGQMIVRIYFR